MTPAVSGMRAGRPVSAVATPLCTAWAALLLWGVPALAPAPASAETLSTLGSTSVAQTGGSGATSHGAARALPTTIDPARCPNAAYRTGLSRYLPDCRAYEQVTPTEKKDASQDLLFDKDGFEAAALASVDGNRVALVAGGVTLGATPQPDGSVSVFERTASGWVTQPVNPADSGSEVYANEPLFNPQLTQVATNAYTTPYPPARESFLVGPPGGPFASIASVPFNNEVFEGDESRLRAASSDLSSVVLETTDHDLLSGESTGTDPEAHDLYRWSGGHLSLVNVKTDGSLLDRCGARLPWSSQDGSEVLFQSPDQNESGEPGCQETPQLYARIDGRETIELSAPEPGVVDPDGPQSVKFVGLSADGSKAFFETTAELTADDAGRHDEQIYEYDMSLRKLTRVTAAVGGLEGLDNVNWYLASEDGSTVYYRNAGNGNLYRYDTETGTTQLVATVAEPSFENALEVGVMPNQGINDATTPDGRFLIFEAQGVSALPLAPDHDELYRYDSADSTVVCVSCSPADKPDRGGAYFNRSSLLTEDRTPRYVAITDDGSEVFFQTDAQLVPADVNSVEANYTGPGSDVYEWHEGAVSLISSGTDEHGDVFLGATPNGSDVFFSTHSQLVAQDTDTLDDIYDARVDGGFASAAETVPCTGDACHNPPPEPEDATPSSATFSGPGNPTPAVSRKAAKPKARLERCPKGKLRRNGRCVKLKTNKPRKRAARRTRGRSK